MFGQQGLRKQCQPRSVATGCSLWSGSTRFATHPSVFRTSSGNNAVWIIRVHFWDSLYKQFQQTFFCAFFDCLNNNTTIFSSSLIYKNGFLFNFNHNVTIFSSSLIYKNGFLFNFNHNVTIFSSSLIYKKGFLFNFNHNITIFSSSLIYKKGFLFNFNHNITIFSSSLIYKKGFLFKFFLLSVFYICLIHTHHHFKTNPP